MSTFFVSKVQETMQTTILKVNRENREQSTRRICSSNCVFNYVITKLKFVNNLQKRDNFNKIKTKCTICYKGKRTRMMQCSF